MNIKFTFNEPISTLIFEKCYEPELRFTAEERSKMMKYSDVITMYVDDDPVGETYGAMVRDLLSHGEEMDDSVRPEDFYVYSTTILPEHQGKQYGLLLAQTGLWLAKTKRYTFVVGHATSPAMRKIRSTLHADFGKITKNWYGTKRDAHLYVHAL